jgi:hypothetical protein
MFSYSLIPVDHQPDFDETPLVPADQGLFGRPNRATGEATITSEVGPSWAAPSIIPFDSGQAASQSPKIDVPSGHGGDDSGARPQYNVAATFEQYSACVDKCMHLLRSPSGDLQSSEFRRCVGQCMGRL